MTPRRIPAAVLAAVLAACGGERASEAPAIPHPPLDRYDQTIRLQVEEAQALLQAALADPETTATHRATLWGDLGNTFHAYELVAAARECYVQASALAPEDARWPYFVGRLERSFGDPDAAFSALRLTVTLDPERVAAWVALGEALLAQDRPAEARSAFEAALERAPVCVPAEVGLAKIALGAGRADEARDRLVAALAAQPEADSIHHHMARACRRLGRDSEAEQHLRLAGARQATLPDPWFERVEQRRLGTHNLMTEAQQAFRAGRFEEAIAVYRRILATEPGHLRAWTNLGAAHARQGQLEEAQAALERAVALDPTDPLARFDLGTVLLRRGNGRAAAELEASLAADPRQPAARFNLAAAYRLAGRHEDALVQYDELLELAAASPLARYWCALTQLRLGLYPAARAGLEEGLRVTADAPLLAATLARLLACCPEAEVRDGQRALELALQVVAAAPDWEHRRTLAMALAETGAYDAAVDEQRRALAAARRDDLPHATLAELERELGGYAANRPTRLAWWVPVGSLERDGRSEFDPSASEPAQR